MPDFKVDDRDLINFSKDLKLMRKSQVSGVQRSVVNDQAKEVRIVAIKQGGPIDKALTLRSKWAKTSVLADFAQPGNNPQSEVGAKLRWKKNPSHNFWGLGDAETGANLQDPNINTVSSRIAGVKTKNVSKKNRDGLENPLEITASTVHGQIGQIKHIEETAPKRPFRIRKGRKGLKKGVYRIGTGRKKTWKDGSKHKPIQMIRDESKSSVTEKKRPWLWPSVKQGINDQKNKVFYQKAFKKYTKRRKSR